MRSKKTGGLSQSLRLAFGKSYAAKVDDEKIGFLEAEQIPNTIGIKISATSIVTAFADKGGQRAKDNFYIATGKRV